MCAPCWAKETNEECDRGHIDAVRLCSHSSAASYLYFCTSYLFTSTSLALMCPASIPLPLLSRLKSFSLDFWTKLAQLVDALKSIGYIPSPQLGQVGFLSGHNGLSPQKRENKKDIRNNTSQCIHGHGQTLRGGVRLGEGREGIQQINFNYD